SRDDSIPAPDESLAAVRFWSAVTCHRFGPGRPDAQNLTELQPRHGRDRSRLTKAVTCHPTTKVWTNAYDSSLTTGPEPAAGRAWKKVTVQSGNRRLN